MIDFRAVYTLNYNFIAWNNRHPILRETDIRRALAMCVPLDAMIRGLFRGTARPVTGPFTPDEWACNPIVKPVPYDLVQAKRILTAHGWTDRDGDGVLEKNGKPFTFDFVVISGNAATQQLGQMLQAEWKKIGVAAQIVTLDGAAAIQRVIAGSYDAAYLAWDLDPDPDPYALFHSSQAPPRGQNIVFYSNPEADRLIERARRELDQTKRKALYWQLHALLAAEQPYTWTVQVSSKWGINKRVRGVESSSATGFFSWFPGELGWWLADGITIVPVPR
jgi:peptide/nickel transport system substrate-binding protein